MQRHERLDHILGGMAKHRLAAMEGLQGDVDWKKLAKAELERRAAELIYILDDELIAAIANGDINLQTAIQNALHN